MHPKPSARRLAQSDDRFRDPHGIPRVDRAAMLQKSEFLRPGGVVVDVCGAGPCETERRAAPQ